MNEKIYNFCYILNEICFCFVNFNKKIYNFLNMNIFQQENKIKINEKQFVFYQKIVFFLFF